MKSQEPLQTADVTRPSDELRGHREEQIENRGEPALADQPSSAPAPVRTPDAAPRVQDRVDTSREAEPRVALFEKEQASRFRRRWVEIQTGFVDEPQAAVQQADTLVAELMKQLADAFANAHATLEKQWGRGDKVTTEDLRVALQRYRSFFDRLLSM